jgi:dihydroorotate dehydrogenase (fumarate)
MDLSTSYLGFDLPHPFMPGASPLADDLDTVRRLEDAGAAAIVLRSLFEEQLVGEQLATHAYLEHPADSYGEALSYLPAPDQFVLGPEDYLEQIQRIKESVGIPVFASLNGTTRGGWLEFARLMEQAGADGLELNVYQLPTDLEARGEELESETMAMVRAVKESVAIPVSVKLSPFYTSLAGFAGGLAEAGADGLVLFNRFYQADLDPEALTVERTLHLSTPAELLLRLRWLAVLSGRLTASLAASGGVHTAFDAVKAVMAGAHAVQVVSALLQHGPEHLMTLRRELADWMEDHGYDSLSRMRGSLSLLRCPDPKAYERANYMLILQSWQGYL